jgi:hypothetical protein
MAYEDQQRYKAVATCNKLATSKNKGTPSVQIRFQTTENMTEQRPEIKTFWADLWLSEKCFDRTMETLSDVFNWSGEDIQSLNNNTNELAGIEVELITGYEEYQDENGETKTAEKVKFINAPGGNIGKKLEDSEALKLSEQLKNKIKAFRMKNPAKSQPEQQKKDTVQNQLIIDNDLPF